MGCMQKNTETQKWTHNNISVGSFGIAHAHRHPHPSFYLKKLGERMVNRLLLEEYEYT